MTTKTIKFFHLYQIKINLDQPGSTQLKFQPKLSFNCHIIDIFNYNSWNRIKSSQKKLIEVSLISSDILKSIKN